ncbi:MAG: universal stress protein [Vicinamibacterales bacterium]
MLSIRTVLCPVDLSPSTSRHVDVAVGICRAFGARLVLHHNIVDLGIGPAVGWMWAPGHPEAEQTAEQRLRELMAHVPEGTESEVRITHGPVVDSVISVSRSVEADLIVLSTRGGAASPNGSVTERVLKLGTVPIFAIHWQLEESRAPRFESDSTERQTLLVPTDLTRASQPAMNVAFDLARRFPFDVHLLHVLPAANSQAEAEARSRMEAMAPDLPHRPKAHIQTGVPAQVIARVADEIAAACIVMGERQRTPLRYWFRPDTSRGVLNPAPCPIWYIPEFPLPVRAQATSADVSTGDGDPRVPNAAFPAEPAQNLVEELRETVFHYWPASHVYGVVDSLANAESALADLLIAGVPRRHLHTWHGTSGKETIDGSGASHGRMARFWRMLEKATPERELLDRYAQEVEKGRVCIGVRCGSGPAQQGVTELLQRHGGHLISYFSVGAVEHLTS